MIEEGQIVLLRFPYVDNTSTVKVRPGVVLRKVPGGRNDWLVCMISSQLDQFMVGVDDALFSEDPGFTASGLKVPSVIRVCRIAVCHGPTLLGAIGRIDEARLDRVRRSLVGWISGESSRPELSDL